MKTEAKRDRKSAKRQTGRLRPSTTELTPSPACPGCAMAKNLWPGEGYTHEGQTFCCQACAEGTGCTCRTVQTAGFSRDGQKRTRAQPRAGEQRAGAPSPQGELSGERDAFGTAEAIDEAECSRPDQKPS